MVVFSYNKTIHSSTKYTPNELTFRISIPHFTETIPLLDPIEVDITKMDMQRLVEDKVDVVYNNMRSSQERKKRYYDRTVQPTSFTIGQDVYCDRQVPIPGLSRKLLQPSLEKCTVTRVHPHGHLYNLRSHRTGKIDVYHSDRLRTHPHEGVTVTPVDDEMPAGEISLPLPEHPLEGDDVYDVDRIILHRYSRDESHEFLIKWSEYSHKYNTWDPEINIYPSLIRGYDRKHG